MAKRVPQSNGIEDEFSPHTALPPPPRSLRRVLSASAQPQSPSQYLPPGNGETLAFMESFPAPVSGLQPVTQESISLPVQSDTLPDALASKGSIKHSSYEDFAKTVTLAEMEIMGPASHYVQERRKSSHVSEVPPPRPAARHGQQIMSFAEIQAALVKLERNGSGGAETGVSPRLHARSSASRNAQSPIKTHGSLVLNTPSSTPNMRPQARGVLPSSSLSHEIVSGPS
ncbi:hypothetical protein K439DRAFT_407720 [Ramaria rubella]|nr:hypothetical protein K439DRAFT_407720 [Ramaria rubella]